MNMSVYTVTSCATLRDFLEGIESQNANRAKYILEDQWGRYVALLAIGDFFFDAKTYQASFEMNHTFVDVEGETTIENSGSFTYDLETNRLFGQWCWDDIECNDVDEVLEMFFEEWGRDKES